MKLEHLADHVRSCEFNSDAKVICDNGCNLTVTRQEYSNSNCLSHMKLEIENLKHRVIFQRKRFEGLANCLYERINKLNDEVEGNRTQKQQLENVIRRQHQEIIALKNKSLANAQPKWQICHNINIDECNNLKIDDPDSSTFAFVQSYHPLRPEKPTFQIKLSKSATSSPVQKGFWIGLTRKGHPIVRNPAARSFACIWNGRIQLDNDCIAMGPRWEDEDVIKLGLKFAENFMIDGNNNAVICLHRNGTMLFERGVKVPKEGLFPTLCIYGKDTRVAYIYE